MTAILQSIAIVLFVWLSFAWPAAANPAICRSWNEHNICILSIKRSAKYPWEYRAAVRIDNQTRPIEKYDCRNHVRIDRDGRSVPFEPHGVGAFVCRLAHQKRR